MPAVGFSVRGKGSFWDFLLCEENLFQIVIKRSDFSVLSFYTSNHAIFAVMTGFCKFSINHNTAKCQGNTGKSLGLLFTISM